MDIQKTLTQAGRELVGLSVPEGLRVIADASVIELPVALRSAIQPVPGIFAYVQGSKGILRGTVTRVESLSEDAVDSSGYWSHFENGDAEISTDGGRSWSVHRNGCILATLPHFNRIDDLLSAEAAGCGDCAIEWPVHPSWVKGDVL